MQFIEMTGKQLLSVIEPDELSADQLKSSSIQQQSIIRVNLQGDIEVRRRGGWELIGGLLGDFEHRVVKETGLDWSAPSAASNE